VEFIEEHCGKIVPILKIHRENTPAIMIDQPQYF
jgi:hypothetical protein